MLLAGSVVRGEASQTSDLDLVVLLAGPPAPYRESLRFAGWPVEAFVHDDASLRRFVAADVARRRPSLAQMLVEGVPVAGDPAAGAALVSAARRTLAAGPPPLAPGEVDDARYRLTDLLDDLAGVREPFAARVVGAELALAASQLALDLAGAWRGGGDWTPRLLRARAPAFARALDDALAALGAGDAAPLAEAVDALLAGVGGRLFDGYRRPAPDASGAGQDDAEAGRDGLD